MYPLENIDGNIKDFCIKNKISYSINFLYRIHFQILKKG